MNKAERLRLAGVIAPALRGKVARRVIKAVDSTGRVTRLVTDVEVAQGVLEKARVEFDVTDAVKLAHCSECGKKLAKPDRRSKRTGLCRNCTCLKMSQTPASLERIRRSNQTRSKTINAEQRKEWGRKGGLARVRNSSPAELAADGARNFAKRWTR